MDAFLLKRAALLQAKLKILDERKDCFTDHSEIHAFHRLKRDFGSLLLSHRDELPPDPLEAVKEDFHKDMGLIAELQHITNQAHAVYAAINTSKDGLLTPDFIQRTLDWLKLQQDSLQSNLAVIDSRLSHEYWDEQAHGLQPDAKILAQFLSEDDLLKADVSTWVAMASMQGSRYQDLLNTISSLKEMAQKKLIYFVQAGRRIGPYRLDDVARLLKNRTIHDSDLAWHPAVDVWLPVVDLLHILEERNVLPSPPCTTRLLQWMKRRWKSAFAMLIAAKAAVTDAIRTTK